MSRLTLPDLDEFGTDADVEFTRRRDVVDVHYLGRCRAVFRRNMLDEWLTYPEGALTVDDVSLSLSTAGVMLSVVPEIPGTPLSQAALEALRRHVS